MPDYSPLEKPYLVAERLYANGVPSHSPGLRSYPGSIERPTTVLNPERVPSIATTDALH